MCLQRLAIYIPSAMPAFLYGSNSMTSAETLLPSAVSSIPSTVSASPTHTIAPQIPQFSSQPSNKVLLIAALCALGGTGLFILIAVAVWKRRRLRDPHRGKIRPYRHRPRPGKRTTVDSVFNGKIPSFKTPADTTDSLTEKRTSISSDTSSLSDSMLLAPAQWMPHTSDPPSVDLTPQSSPRIPATAHRSHTRRESGVLYLDTPRGEPRSDPPPRVKDDARDRQLRVSRGSNSVPRPARPQGPRARAHDERVLRLPRT